MSSMYRMDLNLGGKDKTVVIINQTEETKQQTTSQEVGAIHFIHVVDRSGSMGGYIRSLMDNVEKTLDALGDNDYFSLVWFSSPGQCKTLVKGARKDKESIVRLLNTIRSTLGTTCFSEPMAEVNSIIDDLAAICPNFCVSFFTDGLPVVPWPLHEEMRRVQEQVDKMAPKVLAINTIGFGNYYDRDFMVEMSSKSQFGQYVHSTQIEDYSTIFRHNYERISELVVESTELYAQGAQVLYLTRSSSKLAVDGELTMQALDKRKNQFVLIGDGDFTFDYNGEGYHTAKIKAGPANKATVENIQYAMAYELYYQGQRQASLDILAINLKDRALIDGQLVAFTYDEVAAYSDRLKKAVFHNASRRTEGVAPDGYVPSADAFSVFDAITMLGNSDALYVPGNDYKRVGLKTEDQFNLFKKDASKLSTAPMSDIVFNRDKLNVSLRFTVEGNVGLNPKQAEEVGLPKSVPAKIFRNHTIIKDGGVNVPEMRVLMPQATLDVLRDAQGSVDFIQDVQPVAVVENGTAYQDVRLNLAVLPIINRGYLDAFPTTESVYAALKQQLVLDARAKVLNHYVKATGATIKASTVTDEQLKILKDHGLDGGFIYSGVDNKTASKEDGDFYESRSLSFNIKGMASLPSVKDVLKRMDEKKAFTAGQQVVKDQMDYLEKAVGCPLSTLTDAAATALAKIQQETKKQVLEITARLAALKTAKILTGDWFDNLTTNDKGDFVYTAGDGGVMVIKAEREKVYFTVDAPEPAAIAA
jgi:hypothetical protein